MGAIAGAELLVQAGATKSLVATMLLAVGVLLMAGATAVASGAAPPSEMTIGPAPSALYSSIAKGVPTHGEIRMALLDHAVLAYRHNLQSLERVGRRSRKVSLLLFSGAGAVLGGIAYVVGGAMIV